MAFTVKQVAAMSGVSIRTLHFYDEVGLLKPAYVGANGYRFYEEPQLLSLQQILFYRELGFELKQIKDIVGQADFEKIAALESHRQALKQNLARTQTLIETIDKTIQHLKGTKSMKTEELFQGLSVAAGDDRFGEHIKLGGPTGDPVDCKLSSQDTAGAMCIFELTANAGWPQHLHQDQDEWIYVIEGEIEVQIDKQQFPVRAGESVFIPRKVSHLWCNITDKPVKVINVYQPAGMMEEFFRALGKYDGNPAFHEALSVDEMKQFFEAYGLELLGPPLGWQEDGNK